MSSQRIVASCAAMALIVGIGSWYAVSAFPLHATAQSASAGQVGPGPLERRAKAVTPENPVPRRIHYEAPLLPDTMGATGGTLLVKLTLDDVGRVAEARAIELLVQGNDFRVNVGGDNIRAQVASVVRGMPADTRSAASAAATAFLDAALSSVRQWRYDAPAEAPLSFTVPVRIGKAPEIMAFNPAPADGTLRVGGTIKPPEKVRDVRPVYPPIAKAANVAGIIIIEVRIGKDGRVEEAHVLKSIPLLDEAALDAVKQWEFTPTLMNGQPVPIIMTTTVNFTLQQRP